MASVVTDRYIDALRVIVAVVEVVSVEEPLSFDDVRDAEIVSVSVGEVDNNRLFDLVHVSVNRLLTVNMVVDERVTDALKLAESEGLVEFSGDGDFEIF